MRSALARVIPGGTPVRGPVAVAAVHPERVWGATISGSADMLDSESKRVSEMVANDPHRALAEAAARGDRKAAEALLRALLPRVRNLVRYFVRGDAEVDDISQEALV